MLIHQSRVNDQSKRTFSLLECFRSNFGADRDYSWDHILLLSWGKHYRERALGGWSHVQLLDTEMKEGLVVWILNKSSKYFRIKWSACCQKKKEKRERERNPPQNTVRGISVFSDAPLAFWWVGFSPGHRVQGSQQKQVVLEIPLVPRPLGSKHWDQQKWICNVHL